MSFADRLERLEAAAAIHALKARYARLADAKYTSAYERVALDDWHRVAQLQAACFTEDAAWEGGSDFGGALRGRDAIADWFTRTPWRFALHYYVAPEVTVHDLQRATARWRLWQIALPVEGEVPVVLAATTHEVYRRVADEWLIERMRFEEIHVLDLHAAAATLRCLVPRGPE
jgi:hypothetical protein